MTASKGGEAGEAVSNESSEKGGQSDGTENGVAPRFRRSPEKIVTEEQIKNVMSEDPGAIQFFQGMLMESSIEQDVSRDNSVVSDSKDNDITLKSAVLSKDPNLKQGGSGAKHRPKQLKVKKVFKKVARNPSCNWPYHDSYVPGLVMNKQDMAVVRKSIVKQHFPNEKGRFSL